MEHQEDDEDIQDIPMMDAPDPAPNSSVTQRFSIVDVLGSEAGDGANPKEAATGPTPDPMHSDLYECDEKKVLKRLQGLYPHTDIQKLPRHWNKNDRWMPPTVQNNGVGNQPPILELSSDFLRVTKRKGGIQNSKDAAAVRANRPISRSCIVYYFEVTVVNKGTGGYMGIGLSEKSVSLNRLPGWDQTSYGYHGDDGNFFSSSGKGVEYGPIFTTGDVVGCGLNFVTRKIFFTKNGKHLGVANTSPVPLANDLYPTVGMQTADEMMDANFGQFPFEFDIRSELQAAEAATRNSISNIDLPSEKVLWMNNLVANWMAHEGYSRALDALNQTIGGLKPDSATPVVKSGSQGSTISSTSKDSQSPTAVAETVANSVIRSMLGLFEGENSKANGGGGGRRSVVRSVQEALHEEMEQRRTLVRMVKRGQLDEAIERIEQMYPSLLESNRQLALLLKIQQFVEMVINTSKELPPLPQERLLLHRGGKRAASAVEDESAMAGTSTGDETFPTHHNPVKRRSSDECPTGDRMVLRSSPLQQNQNGNSIAHLQSEEFMEISEESQNGQTPNLVANGRATNGCPTVLLGTPPTSTTIIDEPAGELELVTDGIIMEMGEEKDETQHGGFANAEERDQFDGYKKLLECGHQISQFAIKMDSDELQGQGCVLLRQRMNEAFSLLCFRDPTQSDYAYLLEQVQRDLVAKTLNAAILEMHNREGISPLDKCLRRSRFIRDQALAYSASAVFADTNLLFGENPAASPSQCSTIPGNEKSSIDRTMLNITNKRESQAMDVQKKDQ